jgi:outer membrane protein assembly factor BamB
MFRFVFTGVLAVAALVQSVAFGNWPQWRGPNRDSISADTGLLKEWPKDGPKLDWKLTGLGIGYSSVSIAGNLLFTMGDLKDGCHVICVDLTTKQIKWKERVGNTGGSYAGPRSTPTIDGNRVYALGQHGDFLCLDRDKGTVHWRKTMKEFGGKKGDSWGYSESVLVDGNHVLLTPGGKSTMVALNKTTGALVWTAKTPEEAGAGHSSPVVAEVGGVRHYVQLTAGGVVGVDAKTGKVLWTYGGEASKFARNTANIPTCIVKGDHVFCSVGYRRGGALLKLTPEAGGAVKATEVYYEPKLTNKHGGFVLIGNSLYGDRDASGLFQCVDLMSGNEKWQARQRVNQGGNDSICVTYADGHLYLRYGVGVVKLVEASPDGFKEKGTFKIPNTTEKQQDSWSHPVVIGGKLYLREKDTLWVYDVKAK